MFEKLLTIKRRKYVGDSTANRKITRFAGKELLQYGILMSMKHGFKTLLVDPKGTTHSNEHDEAMKRHSLDRHTASAYMIALKEIKQHTMIQKAII